MRLGKVPTPEYKPESFHFFEILVGIKQVSHPSCHMTGHLLRSCIAVLIPG